MSTVCPWPSWSLLKWVAYVCPCYSACTTYEQPSSNYYINVGIFDAWATGRARGVNCTNRGNQSPCIIQDEQRGVANASNWINKIQMNWARIECSLTFVTKNTTASGIEILGCFRLVCLPELEVVHTDKFYVFVSGPIEQPLEQFATSQLMICINAPTEKLTATWLYSGYDQKTAAFR